MNDWNDVYLSLKRRAEAMRGVVQLHTGTPDQVRWPRTTGADVVAIAAVIDQHIRRMSAQYGRHNVDLRWRACLQDISELALRAPGALYPRNREFWDCLVVAVVNLASLDAELPDPSTLEALLDNLGHVLALRNIGPDGGGPFNLTNAKTFHELYLQQYQHLRAVHGVDALEPGPGEYGGNRNIPRTTNSEVVMLADYWSPQLAGVKEVMGRKSVEKQWAAAVADVNKLARSGDPNAVYAKNNSFWRALLEVGVHVSVADEAPSAWDMAKDSITDSVKQLPDRIGAGAEKLGEMTGGIAQGAGKLANDAARGLFAGLGTPLLIGSGLLGLFLVSRNRGGRNNEPTKE